VNTTTTGNQTAVAPGPDRIGQLIAAGGQAAGAYYGASGSDERIKENVAFVGVDPKGREIFDFDYRPGLGFPEGRFRGVMAQRILKSDPDAVVDIGGVLHVIYGRLN
jgi:hypothetical protein